MLQKLNIETWERKQHFEFFNTFADPYFAVVNRFNVTHAYKLAKKKNVSFFGLYLHACMKAVNSVENFKYRIHGSEVVVYDVIHASATIARPNHTFGCTYILFDEDVHRFLKNLSEEKERVCSTTDLFPPVNSDNCVYCSALPWIPFSGHKEPVSSTKESVPKFGFSGLFFEGDSVFMNVSISVNHALADGYHVGLFVAAFQENLHTLAINSNDVPKATLVK